MGPTYLQRLHTVRSLLYTWNQTPSPCMSLSLSMNELVLPDEDNVITSLTKVVMFLLVFVCLSVCLFVCGQHYSKKLLRDWHEILWRGLR